MRLTARSLLAHSDVVRREDMGKAQTVSTSPEQFGKPPSMDHFAISIKLYHVDKVRYNEPITYK
jgi:hypothetical protein